MTGPWQLHAPAWQAEAPEAASSAATGRRGVAEVIARGPTDVLLLAVVTALVTLGLVSVYSGSAVGAFFDSRDGNDAYYLVRQQTYVGLGLLALLVGMRLDYRWWWRLRYWVLLSSWGMLALVFVPGVGVEVNHATRWINLGFMRFQPAEWAKLASVMYFSYSIAKKGESITRMVDSILFHGVIATIYVALLLLQPDTGTSFIIAAVLMALLWLGGARMHFIIGLGLLGVVGLAALINAGGYRSARVMAWLDPWEHAAEQGYQLVNAYVALASGGIDGVGLGEGRGRLGYIPELYNDFIGAGVGEEFGLLGMGALCALYLVFLWRGAVIALRATDRFGFLLAFGITFLVTLQACINLSVVTGLAPTKGLTLPFVSYGGSSMIVLLLAVGVLLNIGQRNPDLWQQRQMDRQTQREQRRWQLRQARVIERNRTRAWKAVRNQDE
jgi:cell division protein FtsW